MCDSPIGCFHPRRRRLPERMVVVGLPPRSATRALRTRMYRPDGINTLMKQHLTYANVVGTVSLLLAVAGSGVAVAAELGKDSVGSLQIETAAVKKAELARNAVDGSRVRNNRLTGADVRESTLGRVPRSRTTDQLITATVTVEGALIKRLSHGATGVSRATQGFYEVTFDRALDDCSFTATVDARGSSGSSGVVMSTHVPAGGRVVTVFPGFGTALVPAPFTLHGVC